MRPVANHAESREQPTVSRDVILVGGSDLAFREMLQNLMSILSRLEHVRGRFGAYIGLSGVQFTILVTIKQLQGDAGVGVKELADHLGLSAPFVTQETSRLAREGVLEKVTNPADQRRVLLTLTEEGFARLTRLAPLQRKVNDALFEPLDRADFVHLGRIMRNLQPATARGAALADYLFETGRDPA